ncbi:MAG: hypothetical protein ABIH18_08335 [Candidatus Omnitrophota bacterium]
MNKKSKNKDNLGKIKEILTTKEVADYLCLPAKEKSPLLKSVLIGDFINNTSIDGLKKS